METPNAGDQYNLKWNNHLANFVQTFIEHQHGESLVDVTLSCEGQYIKTHKLILSACSDYFHSIFQIHGNIQHPIIFLNGVRFSDLKYILHFMYHGEVKVLDKDLPHVLALGESLQIKGLSSVKLRDMPPEEVGATPVQVPKKRERKELNGKKQRLSTSPLHVSRPLPSEIPHLINSNKAPFDYSRHHSPKLISSKLINKQQTVPVITSISSEMSGPNNTVVVPESPPKSNSQEDEVRTSTNSSPNRDSRTPVPKPPHAFMIFANEWRKKLTVEHPEENNKEISVRLGNMWKNLLPETKNIYYREAKRVEEEHKLKYPNYVSATDSLKRKADVLNDSTNTSSPTTSVDPLQIVEIHEHISVSDSD